MKSKIKRTQECQKKSRSETIRTGSTWKGYKVNTTAKYIRNTCNMYNMDEVRKNRRK